MKKNKSGYEVRFDDFEYKGHKGYYYYEIPFEMFIEGVRAYFDYKSINLDGTDNAIWNAFVEFSDIFDDVESEMEDWFKEHCREDAFEEYKEQVEDDIELDSYEG